MQKSIDILSDVTECGKNMKQNIKINTKQRQQNLCISTSTFPCTCGEHGAGVEAGAGLGGRWAEERRETDGERQARVTERRLRE